MYDSQGVNGKLDKSSLCGLDRPARSAMVGRNKSRSVLCGKCRCVACHIGASRGFDYGELILFMQGYYMQGSTFRFSCFLVLHELKTTLKRLLCQFKSSVPCQFGRDCIRWLQVSSFRLRYTSNNPSIVARLFGHDDRREPW